MEAIPIGRSMWYLSFCRDGSWLGSCYVEATDIADAMKAAAVAGCNPGGEVLGLQATAVVRPEYRNRLLTTRAEVEDATGDPRGSCKTYGECIDAGISVHGDTACADCNTPTPKGGQ